MTDISFPDPYKVVADSKSHLPKEITNKLTSQPCTTSIRALKAFETFGKNILLSRPGEKQNGEILRNNNINKIELNRSDLKVNPLKKKTPTQENEKISTPFSKILPNIQPDQKLDFSKVDKLSIFDLLPPIDKNDTFDITHHAAAEDCEKYIKLSIEDLRINDSSSHLVVSITLWDVLAKERLSETYTVSSKNFRSINPGHFHLKKFTNHIFFIVRIDTVFVPMSVGNLGESFTASTKNHSKFKDLETLSQARNLSHLRTPLAWGAIPLSALITVQRDQRASSVNFDSMSFDSDIDDYNTKSLNKKTLTRGSSFRSSMRSVSNSSLDKSSNKISNFIEEFKALSQSFQIDILIIRDPFWITIFSSLIKKCIHQKN